MAKGSLEEVRYYLILIQDLKYADTKTKQEDIIEVSKILNASAKSIN